MIKMLTFLISMLFISSVGTFAQNETRPMNPWAVDFARSFSKDIFETNGIPYVKPMVEAVNATSNSRFFNSAFVSDTNQFYFKLGLNFMFGFVHEDMKHYHPTIPNEPFDPVKAAKFGAFNNDPLNPKFNITDTSGLIYYMFKTVMYNGLSTGQMTTPETAATVLGRDSTAIILDRDVLKTLVKQHQVWAFLPKDMQDSILNVIDHIPNYNTLPPGGDIDYIFAGVPQIEIGSLYGTEALIRYVPEINMGSNIGKFTFWGFGLKHSLSQYFKNNRGVEPFHLALQAVYQGTRLTNVIGFTKAEMKSNAEFWNVNLQASYDLLDIVEIYGGVAYENIDINTKYTYVLGLEQQYQLGLLEWGVPHPTPGYPGDTKPQTSNLNIFDENFKFIIGLNKKIWNFEIFADYNISQFNIFTAGIKYTFK